jgi:DNA-binding winged helix-turn-helix (wHTH) protein
MLSSRETERIVRFGLFEFRPDTQELRKDGIRVRVQAKPLQVLRALIDRPGELITREELRHELWPDGTFVDFESGLNSATNRLRAALNDSAEQPRYIETVPRLGYRFICPVTCDEPSVAHNVHSSDPPREERLVQTKNDDLAPTFNRHFLSNGFGRKPRYAMVILLVAITILVLAIYSRFERHQASSEPVFHPLTYRPQVIYSARFLPGGKSAIYSTYSEPVGIRSFRLGVDNNNAPAIPVSDGSLLSVSPGGDLLLRDSPADQASTHLVKLSPAGQKLNVGVDNARAADWLPNGQQLAIVCRIGIEYAVEFPAGHVAYRSSGWLSDLRVSPAGDQAAFIEHPVRDDDRGHIRVLNKDGKTRTLTADWNSAGGLAWSPSRREIWFTASKTAVARSLYAVSMSGALRRLSNAPPSLRLFDIGSDGRLLVSVDELRASMLAAFPGAHQETDVTEFDEPNVQAISSDGQRVLFTESGDAGGQHYTTMLFDNNRHSSRIIGFGRALALSPDARSALIMDAQDDTALTLVSLQDGSSRRITGGGLHYQWARFLPHDEILAGASYSSGMLMLFRQSTAGSPPVGLAGLPYLDYPSIAPDGCRAVGRSGPDFLLLDLCNKRAQSLPVPGGAIPAGWSAEGRSIVVSIPSGMPPKLMKFDLGSSSLTTWKTLKMPESSSLAQLGSIATAPDVEAYAYSLEQQLSRLYIVDGWS